MTSWGDNRTPSSHVASAGKKKILRMSQATILRGQEILEN
jgi:hypothetical protein